MSAKNLAFLAFVIFAALSASAQTPRNLLAGKLTLDDVKRDLIPRNKWQPYPKTSAEWKAKLSPEMIDEIIKRGESLIDKPVPQTSATLLLEYVRTGNRSHYEQVSFARRNNLFDLVLAEAVEDKGRFTDTIVNYVWAICEETYWGVPAHLGAQKAKNGLPDSSDPIVELFGAETAATLALTDHLVGPKLDKVSPLIRKRIYSETVKKILDPIRDTKRYGWLDPTKKVNNWNPWIISNVITADLLLEPDEAKRADNLYLYLKLLDVYINGLGDDGGCDEGPSYWFAAGASVFDSLDMLDSATGGKINIYNEPFIGKMASYIYKMHIAGNYFVDFADADPRFNADGVVLYRFGKAIKDDALTQFGLSAYARNKRVVGEGFMKPRRLSDLLAARDLPATNTYSPPAEAWFSDIQVMTARSRSGLFLATHAGNNGESHNHNDVGDFIVYMDGEPVIIDAGRGNYTAKTFSSHRYELWFTESQYHNLPIVNGIGQSDGRQFAAGTVVHGDRGLTMDIAPAYPKEAGINSWKRSIALKDENDTVTITDDYSLKTQPTSLQQIFMTVCDVDISTPGKIGLTTAKGKRAVVIYDAGSWTVTTENPSTTGPEYSSFVEKWEKRPIVRIILSAKSPKTTGEFGYTVSRF